MRHPEPALGSQTWCLPQERGMMESKQLIINTMITQAATTQRDKPSHTRAGTWPRLMAHWSTHTYPDAVIHWHRHAHTVLCLHTLYTLSILIYDALNVLYSTSLFTNRLEPFLKLKNSILLKKNPLLSSPLPAPLHFSSTVMFGLLSAPVHILAGLVY